MIITIDGPAASGKSTISKGLSKRLGFRHLDTGAMYRALTWAALKNKINLGDGQALAQLANKSTISFKYDQKGQVKKIYINDFDVTEEIRKPIVSQNVSQVSKYSGVRKAMVKMQREISLKQNIVAEGRDCGTVVFPEADLKIYLTATIGERAKRRGKELAEKGLKMNSDILKKEIVIRDNKDSTRQVSPLVKASDAHVIDTTQKSIEQVIDDIVSLSGVGK